VAAARILSAAVGSPRRTVDALTGSRTPKLDAKQIILTAQFIQQRLGVFQVASIEVFGDLAEIFVNAG
jgi:hypothetical protein